MKHYLLALAAAMCITSPALAQTSTRIVGRASDGIDRPILATTDGKLQVDTGATGSSGVAQGSTTAGQTGNLTQCAVVSGDQTYTAGTTNPCTMTASGRVRIGLSSATNIIPGLDLSPGRSTDLVGCTYRTPVTWTVGWSGALECTSDGSVKVEFGTVPTVARQDSTTVATTPVSANSTVLFTADTTGYGGVGFQVTGTWVGTVAFQYSDDNTNWVSGFAQASSSAVFVSSTTAVGAFYMPSQHRYIRAVTSGYSSGTIASAAYLRMSSLDPTPATTQLSASSAIIGATYSNISVSNAASAGLFSTYRVSSAATTNGALIITSTHRVIGGQACNTTSTPKFVKLYNKATAPTVGTDTPLVTITIPGAASGTTCMSFEPLISVYGLSTPLGLGIAITGAFADSDTTATAANDVTVQLLYL